MDIFQICQAGAEQKRKKPWFNARDSGSFSDIKSRPLSMDSTGYVNSQTGIFIYIHLVIIGYGCVLPWICHIYSSTWTLRSCQPWKSSTVDSYFSIIYIHIHTVYNTFYGFLSLLPLFLSSLDNVDHNALENKLRTLLRPKDLTTMHPKSHSK